MVFWIWGSLFVLTVIAEIASQQLISIWFAAVSNRYHWGIYW